MKRTAVALSGGIDSLAAARILQEKGHKPLGIHFLSGFSSVSPEDVQKMGKEMGIRVETADCREDFRKKVVDYFVRTYRKGRTPNPCLLCNSLIKFGSLLSFARKLGAERLATGHYARVSAAPSGRYMLRKAADFRKDQSYFLAFLSQKQLASACFPLGDMTKETVRRLAAEKGLTPVTQKESQDICFIKDSYPDFLEKYAGFSPEPGPVTDRSGKKIGEHQGLHLFTVGQRRGISCPASEPYYVLALDKKNNRLIVGFKKDLYTPEFRVTGLHWICPPSSPAPLPVQVKVRYRHQAVPATVFPESVTDAIVRFESPHPAVTPGQGAVFYQGDEVLGGGWIMSVE
ncbi:MAG: tRNA 2-thiouridine(34) synthase MnmA [Desulfococcaceae bacterium]|jgi:tRNA-specific 2-thiouridylase|nr:tRNA 2-thiouridine(34) synthase MnmA [Desulfococcaceae bacterium]